MFARQISDATDTFELGASHYDASMDMFGFLIHDGSVPLNDGQCMQEDLQTDADGSTWVTTAGCLDAKQQSSYEGRIQMLLNTLGHVKVLFKNKFGEDLSDNNVEEDEEEDADGSRWTRVAGEGISNAAQFEPSYLIKLATLEHKLIEVKTAYRSKHSWDAEADEVITQDEKLQKLARSLEDVKALYEKKFAHSIDAMDEDGSVWVASGNSTSFESSTYFQQLHALEDTLCDVKTLYRKTFGLDVDQDEVTDEEIVQELDADGATWTVRSARPRDEEEAHETSQKAKLQELERVLYDVKVLYEQKYGHGHDADVDEDGALWLHYAGSAAATQPALYAQKLDQLEQQVLQVKVLYREKFGVGADEDFLEDDMSYEDKVQVLENSLEGVKTLYEQKYGYTLDDMDEDGSVWVTAGDAHHQDEYKQKLGGLQSKLAEITSMYNQKYSYEEKVEALEDSVNKVKQLFEQKYGCCIDDVDDSGTRWFKTGELTDPQDARSRRLAGLELRLVEVKTLFDQTYSQEEKLGSLDESVNDLKWLFQEKFGYSIEDELDHDGAIYRQIKGDREPEDGDYDASLTALESMLAVVTALYNEKYGYDEKLQALETSMSDVKGLFEQKYGCDSNFMEDYGTQWICNSTTVHSAEVKKA